MDWFSENLFKIANQQDIDSIVLIGAAFKENTDDLRESPTLAIYDRLQNNGLNIAIFDKNIKLNSDYSFIAKLDDLKDNCLYVEMFPDISDERKILISKIKSLNNTFMLKLWE